MSLLHAWELKRVPGLRVKNLGCDSETSDSFIANSQCGGSQLDKALTFIAKHRGHIVLLTIDIGGNDVLGCSGASAAQGCVNSAIGHLDANLKLILSKLRAATGSDAPFVSMTYFDPVLYLWFHGTSGQAAARGSIPVVDTLNRHVTLDYAPSNTVVAQVGSAFAVDDWTVVDSPYGRVPRNVANACAWLNIANSNNECGVLGSDATAAGYRVIATEFENALDPSAVPDTTMTTTASDSSGLADTGSDEGLLTVLGFTLVALGALLLGIQRTSRLRRRDVLE